MRVLVTGGCGFIGSAVVRHLINDTDHEVINVDKITYAATEGSVAEVADNERYRHLKIDICDGAAVEAAFLDHQPDAVMHLAAESHVDRSIDAPEQFLQTNIVGTLHLLQAARSLMLARIFHEVITGVFIFALSSKVHVFVVSVVVWIMIIMVVVMMVWIMIVMVVWIRVRIRV